MYHSWVRTIVSHELGLFCSLVISLRRLPHRPHVHSRRKQGYPGQGRQPDQLQQATKGRRSHQGDQEVPVQALQPLRDSFNAGISGKRLGSCRDRTGLLGNQHAAGTQGTGRRKDGKASAGEWVPVMWRARPSPSLYLAIGVSSLLLSFCIFHMTPSTCTFPSLPSHCLFCIWVRFGCCLMWFLLIAFHRSLCKRCAHVFARAKRYWNRTGIIPSNHILNTLISMREQKANIHGSRIVHLVVARRLHVFHSNIAPAGRS